MSSLAPESVATTLRQVQESGESATAVFDATWTLPGQRSFSYTGQLPLSATDDGWRVRWSPADLHPQLGANQSIELADRRGADGVGAGPGRAGRPDARHPGPGPARPGAGRRRGGPWRRPWPGR